MMRTGFIKLSCFFSYSLQHTSHDFENNRKTMLTEKNQSVLSWVVSQPPLSWLAGSSKKPLLIVEVSLKIRYFDFNERSYCTRCSDDGKIATLMQFHCRFRYNSWNLSQISLLPMLLHIQFNMKNNHNKTKTNASMYILLPYLLC